MTTGQRTDYSSCISSSNESGQTNDGPDFYESPMRELTYDKVITMPPWKTNVKPESKKAETAAESKDRYPSIIGGRWELGEVLGEGGFGTVHTAVDLKTGQSVAVKIEAFDRRYAPSLNKEYEVYSRLSILEDYLVGFPKCLFHGRVSPTHMALVIEKLGFSLYSLRKKAKKRRLCLKTALMLGIQGVRRLEHLHHMGYLHCDVKPDNMLMSAEDTGRMYLVDFGVSKNYLDKDGNHVKKTVSKYVPGTYTYWSTRAHMGVSPSRRCDLESLGYVLVELVLGSLPWRDKNGDPKKIGALKLKTNLKELCSPLGKEFLEYFRYVKMMKYEEKPDYGFLRDLFRQGLKRNGWKNDRKFEWTEK